MDVTASLQGVGAITVFVEDLQRSRSFYSEVFGLRVIFEDASSAAFDFGNTIINLLAIADARDLVGPGAVAESSAGVRILLSIWVDDVDAVCADLDRHGVALLDGPVDRDWGKRTASFADPDGNIWEIAQDLPAANTIAP